MFVTHDGVDVYNRRSEIAVVHRGTFELKFSKIVFDDFARKCAMSDYLRFSSKEKAEEYIILNKPVLSINDLLDFLEHKTSKPLWNWDRTTPSFERDIRELVKSRL